MNRHASESARRWKGRTERVADPLGGMWLELNWILREDPNEEYALASLDQIVSGGRHEPLVSITPPPRELDSIDPVDIEAILDDARERAIRRAGLPVGPDTDALAAYLDSLDQRGPSPSLLVR